MVFKGERAGRMGNSKEIAEPAKITFSNGTESYREYFPFFPSSVLLPPSLLTLFLSLSLSLSLLKRIKLYPLFLSPVPDKLFHLRQSAIRLTELRRCIFIGKGGKRERRKKAGRIISDVKRWRFEATERVEFRARYSLVF